MSSKRKTNKAPNTDVRCSEHGCKNTATWSRQGWLPHSPDKLICDSHVKFYKAHGLTCTRIDRTKFIVPKLVGFQCPACGHDMGEPIDISAGHSKTDMNYAGDIYRCEQCKMNWLDDFTTGEVYVWNE